MNRITHTCTIAITYKLENLQAKEVLHFTLSAVLLTEKNPPFWGKRREQQLGYTQETPMTLKRQPVTVKKV